MEIADARLMASRVTGRGARMALVGVVLLTAACPAPTTTTVDVVATPPQAMAPTEGALVVIPSLSLASHFADPNLTPCVTRRLQKEVPGRTFIGFDAFRDAMFPWLEPGHVPEDIRELKEFLARPLVRDRAAELGVRHIIHLGGATEDEVHGGMGCGGAGAPVPGCVGVTWGEAESRYTASVWNLASGTETAQIAARSSGRSAAVGVLIPLAFIAYTDRAACRALSDQLGAMLQGTAPPG